MKSNSTSVMPISSSTLIIRSGTAQANQNDESNINQIVEIPEKIELVSTAHANVFECGIFFEILLILNFILFKFMTRKDK